MTQTSSFDDNAHDILRKVTKSVYKQDGNEGDPPAIPTPDDLKDHFQAEHANKVMIALLQNANSIRDEATEAMRNRAKEIVDSIPPTASLDTLTTLQICAALYVRNDRRLHPQSIIEHLSDNELENQHSAYFQASLVLAQTLVKFKDDPEQAIENLHQAWKIGRKFDKDLKHPLAPVIRAWLTEQTHRTIRTATVDQANGLTTIPYVVSEVNRRKWEIAGSVDAVEVDGEPIVTHISQLPGRWMSDDEAWECKPYKPKGTRGELMPMPPQRNNIETPIPLVAYQKWGDNLKASLASDVAQLMCIAYAANEPLILTVKDGARLLARGQDGELRKPQSPDERRFERAFSCVHGMAAWIEDERGIPRFYPLTACDRFSDNRVSIAAASWARDRRKGRWTLSAGFGIAGQNRLKGNAHNNNIWRVITGVEYWLARGRFTTRGTHKRTSQALIPANGTTGPGNWHTLKWQELMMIAGDVWDLNDKEAKWRAYQRFNKIRSALIQHGYQVKNLNTSAEAGDTVEFLFAGKDGKVKVRATDRFVEGARKAKRQEWQTVNLNDFLGF